MTRSERIVAEGREMRASNGAPRAAAVSPPGDTRVRGTAETLRRFGWGLLDQVLSSATNFMLGVLVARAVTPREFGAFSIVYAVFTLSLGATRAAAGEPLMVRFSAAAEASWRDAVRLAAATALTLGIVAGLGCVAAALVAGGVLGAALAAVGVALPALLLQDVWRYGLFACGRGRSAFLNDLLWAIAMFAAIAVLVRTDRSSIGWLTAAWAGSGTAAALFGVIQTGIVPRAPLGFEWFRRHRDLAPRFVAEFCITTGSANLLLFAVGALAGLAELGRLRAGMVALGPLNILFMGATMATVPEGVRLLEESSARLRWASVLTSLVLGAGVLAWALVVWGMPSQIGHLLLRANWDGAHQLIVPLSIGSLGSGLTFGAMTGLRALAAARRSLRARALDSLANVVLVLAGAWLGGARGAAWGYAAAGCVRVPNWWWQFTGGIGEHVRSAHARSPGTAIGDEHDTAADAVPAVGVPSASA